MTGDLKVHGNSFGRMSWKSVGSNYFVLKFSTLRLIYSCFIQIGNDNEARSFVALIHLGRRIIS